MAGLRQLLKPSRVLRQRALYRGVFGGDRLWLSVGAVMWVWKFMRRTLKGGDPTARYIEELKPGERLVITHPESKSRRQRRRSA